MAFYGECICEEDKTTTEDKFDLGEGDEEADDKFDLGQDPTQSAPLEDDGGTFYFDISDNYLGAAHEKNGRPGSMKAEKGGWQEVSVVKKSPGVYTLMSYQGSEGNRKYYYLSNNNDSINFNTQDINQSTSLSISVHDKERYSFQRISDNKYITYESGNLSFKEKISGSHETVQQWRFTRTERIDIDDNINLEGTYYFDMDGNYLGPDHTKSGRPGSVSRSRAYKELSIVKKSPAIYTLMCYDSTGNYYYLSNNYDNINFNTQDINQSTSLSISIHDDEQYSFERISDNKYITFDGRILRFEPKSPIFQLWRYVRLS